MSSIRTLLSSTAATALVVLGSGVATADPAVPAPLPINNLQAPGLPAMETLGPAIQQAAADPQGAASMLMAAAAAFAGNAAAPDDSKNMATAVNQFAADPAAHMPAAGAGPEAHLPAGVDPAHAVGPLPEAAPAAVAAPAPDAAPLAAPAPAPDAVPAPAPAPAPGPAPIPAPGGVLSPDAATKQDFMYPSISNGCLGDGGNVLATAISVAGPAAIPTPGPGPGQTAYVFTAVGTPGPAAEQKLPLNVTWVNLSTGKSGTATLKPRADMNPEGPTTLTVIADTGSGSIMSTIFGQVTTTEKQCQFMPTIGSTVVP
ncbi:Rv1157c family protein [Mycobacterium sp. BMJ-28]